MRSNKNLIPILIMLIVISALYRIIPGRPWGFAPQMAMALFAGAVIKDKIWAFAIPIFSMFISDMLYQFLFNHGLTTIEGFYRGQITNYLLFAGLTAVGFLMKKINVSNVVIFSFVVSILFFVFSNFLVWINGGGLYRPMTLDGLLLCYNDGLPFFKWNVISTLLFSGIFFGAWKLMLSRQMATA